MLIPCFAVLSSSFPPHNYLHAFLLPVRYHLCHNKAVYCITSPDIKYHEAVIHYGLMSFHLQPKCLSNYKNISGWPHSSQNEIPCVFPEFSMCYKNFPCVIFT